MRSFFQEIWIFKELFYFLVWRDIKVRYKQSLLGISWAIIQPFLTMIVFTVFFGKLMNIPTDDIPYPIFYYSALLPWTFFSGGVTYSGNSLIANANLIRKVYFPRIALPASAVFGRLLDFFIAATVLFGMIIYYGEKFDPEIIILPFLLLLLILFTTGLGMILAALNVRYRDVKHAIPFMVQLLLFLTPIIYPTSMVPDKINRILVLNPLVGIINGFRSSLLVSRSLDWPSLLISTFMTLFVFFIGLLYFSKTEKGFADII